MKNKIYLFETLGALLLLGVLNLYVLPHDIGMLEYRLHPYFFITILIASRYGLAPGTMTGVICGLVYITMVYFNKQIFSLRLLFEFDTYFLPVVFILTGSFLGELREKYRQKLVFVLEQKIKYETQYKNALDSIKVLQNTNAELEKRIVGNFSTFSILYEASRGLDTLDIDEVYNAVRTILDKHLQCTGFAMYIKKDVSFKRVVHFGCDDCPEFLTAPRDMTRLALENKDTMSIRSLLHTQNDSFAGQPVLLSGPLLDSAGRILGFIEVYDMPFLQYNPHTIQMFKMITHWIGSSLEKIAIFAHERSKDIFARDLNIYTYTYFKKRLQEEFARSRLYAMPLSMALFTIGNFDDIPLKNTRKLLQIICNIFQNHLSDIDIISQYASPETFGLLFIAKSHEETATILASIRQDIESYNLSPYRDKDSRLEFSIRSDSFSMDDASYKDLVKRVEKKR